ASWCGRFNLGISLFDYICDESGRSSILPDLPAFEFLRKQPRNNNTPISKNEYPIEWLLNNLAQTVLDELAVEIGTPVWTKKRNGLWDALRSMFEAELMVTTSPDGTKENLQQIKRALCLKSAEPFRIMAEFVALGATKKDRPSKLRKARAYGRALGRCYWLIDDAKDIWADFDKKQWNIFLVHVAEKEPDLFMRSRDAITDFHLAKTLMKLRLSKKESVYAIQRLIHSLDELTINSQIREKIEGYIAASLLRWYRFG
ncbi:MAG: hypothetical protein ACE5I1_32600, partial [bacterium]